MGTEVGCMQTIPISLGRNNSYEKVATPQPSVSQTHRISFAHQAQLTGNCLNEDGSFRNSNLKNAIFQKSTLHNLPQTPSSRPLASPPQLLSNISFSQWELSPAGSLTPSPKETRRADMQAPAKRISFYDPLFIPGNENVTSTGGKMQREKHKRKKK